MDKSNIKKVYKLQSARKLHFSILWQYKTKIMMDSCLLAICSLCEHFCLILHFWQVPLLCFIFITVLWLNLNLTKYLKKFFTVVVDFFNRVNLIYGTVSEFCTAESCPVMSGGPK